jgi:hypothetical protein
VVVKIIIFLLQNSSLPNIGIIAAVESKRHPIKTRSLSRTTTLQDPLYSPSEKMFWFGRNYVTVAFAVPCVRPARSYRMWSAEVVA